MHERDPTTDDEIEIDTTADRADLELTRERLRAEHRATAQELGRLQRQLTIAETREAVLELALEHCDDGAAGGGKR